MYKKIKLVLLLLCVCLMACTTSDGNIVGSRLGKGQIWIGIKNSTEAGRIFIDHKITEKSTPDTLNLAVGDHVVHLFVPNYQTVPESMVVNVAEGELRNVEFSLEEIQSGTLQITSSPDSVDVRIDGLFYGTTPLMISGISTGVHQLEAEKLLYRSSEKSIEVGYNQTVTQEFSLQEKPAEKVILLEHFSNASCPPCPTADDTIHQILNDLAGLNIEVISWHVKFPSPNDPFYIAEKENNDARAEQYNVTFTPTVFVDSRRISFNSFSQLGARLRDSLVLHSNQIPQFAKMDIRVEKTGAMITGKVAIKTLKNLPPDVVIRVACIQLHREFEQAPGTNGQTEFSHVMSGLWPDAEGTVIQAGQNETLEIAYAIPRLNDLEGDLKVIAFLQEGVSGEILQVIGSRVFK